MMAAGAIALALALAVMYVALRKYTYPAVEEPFFSDPTLFMLFALGLVEGTVLFAAYTWLDRWWGSVYVVVAFAAVVEMAKMVTLNLRRFSGKSDTVFYGFGLGLGVGAAFAFGMVYFISLPLISEGGMDAASWASVLLLSVFYVLLHSATGTIVGEGVARRRIWELFLRALLFAVVCQLILVPLYLPIEMVPLPVKLASVAAAAAAAAAAFHLTVRRNLPGVVSDVLKMEGKGRRDVPRRSAPEHPAGRLVH